MSAFSKKAIPVDSQITFSEKEKELVFQGPKGTLTVPRLSFVSVEKQAQGELLVRAQAHHRQAKMNEGTTWALIRNALKGVTEGYVKVLEIEGIGYRAAVEGSALVLGLGFSHPVHFPIPEGITITVDKKLITVSGINKELVGEIAARIRSLKKPEPYKGKGIHYQGEVIRRKAGKKAASSS